MLLFIKVKDLKRQLKLERKRVEQLQQRLQEALSENRVKPSKFINVLTLDTHWKAPQWKKVVIFVLKIITSTFP